jgi:hypothetical protein
MSCGDHEGDDCEDNQLYQSRMVADQFGATYTEPDEEAKLRDLFGEPNEDGVYGASGR